MGNDFSLTCGQCKLKDSCPGSTDCPYILYHRIELLEEKIRKYEELLDKQSELLLRLVPK